MQNKYTFQKKTLKIYYGIQNKKTHNNINNNKFTTDGNNKINNTRLKIICDIKDKIDYRKYLILKNNTYVNKKLIINNNQKIGNNSKITTSKRVNLIEIILL